MARELGLFSVRYGKWLRRIGRAAQAVVLRALERPIYGGVDPMRENDSRMRVMSGQMRERLAGTAIRGITQPLLVLSLGFGLPAIGFAHFLDGAALYFDLGLAAFFPMLFGITHVYFMFANPDRLQSEDYRLRDRSLSLVESGRGFIRDPELLEISTSPVAEAALVQVISSNDGGAGPQTLAQKSIVAGGDPGK
jgi:hypothetical protein